MSSFNNLLEFKKKYSEILNLLEKKIPSKSDLLKKEIINLENEENLGSIAENYCSEIENNNNYMNYLLNRRVKLFYKKSTVVLIKGLNLKKVLERSDEKTQNKVWETLQLLYAVYRTGDKSKKKFIRNLVGSVEKFNLSENQLIEHNSDEVETLDTSNTSKKTNSNAEEMMKDITESLKKSFIDKNEKGEKINPIENIINLTKTIGEKYKSKISKGELTLNDMMGSLQNMMKNMDLEGDEKLGKLNEDDFKADPLINQLMSSGVDNMIKEMKNGNLDSVRRIMKDMNPEKILGSMPGLSGLSGSLGSMLGKGGKKDKDAKDFKDEPLTEEQLKEIEEFYKKVEEVNNSKLENLSNNENIEVLD